MIEQDVDTALKVIVVGNGQVGKTSMITRFARGVFTDTYKKTLAVDFLEKRMIVGTEEVTFLLWDTAGQEEYDAITRGYYRGAGCCIIAFSTTDRASFDAVESWHKKVRDECGNIVVVLAQNKCDLLDQATMTAGEVEALASRLQLKLYRLCVKDNLNITEIFSDLGMEYLRRGGELGLGVSAVASITPQAVKAGPSGSAPAEEEKTENLAFQLTGDKKPNVQRTGGKKKRFATCSIL
ncbi:unnamed protein product [Amoebophrya sp. A25]|nr:unnamed protein product [Amoebophrya sp. A25]|eukprot:GSA25T00026972001.1